MRDYLKNQGKKLLLVGVVAAGLGLPKLSTQASAETAPRAPGTSSAFLLLTASVASSSAANTSSDNRSNYLRRTWGITDLEIRSTSSGELIRFSYRVLDANRAAPLNDKKLEPHLIDESSGYMLQIPSLEKVGQLRQTATPQDGVQYWMVFSNKGRLVKPGNRVDIIIGNFRVNGLIVDPSALKISK